MREVPWLSGDIVEARPFAFLEDNPAPSRLVEPFLGPKHLTPSPRRMACVALRTPLSCCGMPRRGIGATACACDVEIAHRDGRAVCPPNLLTTRHPSSDCFVPTMTPCASPRSRNAITHDVPDVVRTMILKIRSSAAP